MPVISVSDRMEKSIAGAGFSMSSLSCGPGQRFGTFRRFPFRACRFFILRQYVLLYGVDVCVSLRGSAPFRSPGL